MPQRQDLPEVQAKDDEAHGPNATPQSPDDPQTDATLAMVPKAQTHSAFDDLLRESRSPEEIGALIEARGKALKQEIAVSQEKHRQEIEASEQQHRHQLESLREQEQLFLDRERHLQRLKTERDKLERETREARSARNLTLYKLLFSFAIFLVGILMVYTGHEETGLIIAGGGVAAVAEEYASKIPKLR